MVPSAEQSQARYSNGNNNSKRTSARENWRTNKPRFLACYHFTVLNSRATVGTTRIGHVTRRKGGLGHSSHLSFQQSIHYIMVREKSAPCNALRFYHGLVLSEHYGIVLIAL